MNVTNDSNTIFTAYDGQNRQVELPVELCLTILSHLPPKELVRSELTSKMWKQYAEDDLLWRSYAREFKEVGDLSEIDALYHGEWRKLEALYDQWIKSVTPEQGAASPKALYPILLSKARMWAFFKVAITCSASRLDFEWETLSNFIRSSLQSSASESLSIIERRLIVEHLHKNSILAGENILHTVLINDYQTVSLGKTDLLQFYIEKDAALLKGKCSGFIGFGSLNPVCTAMYREMNQNIIQFLLTETSKLDLSEEEKQEILSVTKYAQGTTRIRANVLREETSVFSNLQPPKRKVLTEKSLEKMVRQTFGLEESLGTPPTLPFGEVRFGGKKRKREESSMDFPQILPPGGALSPGDQAELLRQLEAELEEMTNAKFAWPKPPEGPKGD